MCSLRKKTRHTAINWDIHSCYILCTVYGKVAQIVVFERCGNMCVCTGSFGLCWADARTGTDGDGSSREELARRKRHWCWNKTLLCSLQDLRRDIVGHRGDLDRLCQLYCSLAHAGRDDSASELRMKVDEACQRWKTLSQRISSVMKRDSSTPTVDKELESLAVCCSLLFTRFRNICKVRQIL